MHDLKHYSPFEEKINIGSHAVGFVMSVIALALLVARSIEQGTALHILSFSVFGVSMLVVYAASVAYHSASSPERRARLRIIDHAAIYLLIAGTYTPFALITLSGTTGWTLFGVSWAMAILGISLKIFFTGKYDFFSTLMYILMGWMVIFAIKPLAKNLATEGLLWLFAGGLSYTIGAIVYAIKKLKLNHAIFHVFVVAGSVCHVIAVLFYVLPG